ncbi:MAG: 5-(carboxyamino)imidazole ribonucleotide synthase [Bacteroidales bacterium]|nr:5-(carboxyamino)imidazole ribonucleotide synthase [Bacteroidales bacterium]
MEKLVTSDFKLGIIAGGQLAKMLIQKASRWDVVTYVLDKDETCPAKSLATHFVKGSNLDFDSVYQFGKMVDLLTYEMENINIEALKRLKSEGYKILPDPDILELIQDKGKQKEFYQNNNLPTAPFKIYDSRNDITRGIKEGEIKFPFVQKLRTGGYDGRGVAVINGESDLHKLLEGPSVIEDKVDIAKEIAVITARNKKGEIKCHPVVEMVFDPKANLVDKLICPSTITEEQSEKATRIASRIIESLNMQGLLAVEFFIDTKGEVIVNESAPRPHNSGHHTIEGIITSQFEQHLRAIFNLPLGSTKIKMPAVMLNILGGEGYEGPVKYEGLTEIMAIEGVKIHLYGKKITMPYRKMGHITVLGETLEAALEKAEKVKHLIKVKSWDKN